MNFSRIAIIGIGLIGASFALALKRAGAVTEVIGIDADSFVLELAKRRGAIDRIGVMADVRDVDLVLLAIPVRQMGAAFVALRPHLSPHTVVMDAGSTKQDVITAARSALGGVMAQFVPAHPIAGRELHGPMAAEADLFVGKRVVIAMLPETHASATQRATAAWEACGARVVTMLPATHDAVFAAVSHLPHMLAFALVDELAARPNAKLLFEHAASGFRDFTRIASSSPEMWRDIALNNREALLNEIDRYTGRVKALRDALAAEDGDQLIALMRRAALARERWLSGELSHFQDEAR